SQAEMPMRTGGTSDNHEQSCRADHPEHCRVREARTQDTPVYTECKNKIFCRVSQVKLNLMDFDIQCIHPILNVAWRRQHPSVFVVEHMTEFVKCWVVGNSPRAPGCQPWSSPSAWES